MTRDRVFPALPILLVLFVVLLDQLVKWIVVREIGPDSDTHSLWLVDDWIGLQYAENTGVAFGLLQGRSTFVLVGASTAVLILIGVYVFKHRHSLAIMVAGGLVAGGAIGNMFDRIRFGYVQDFFSFGPWPSFNIADSAITIGVLLALLGSMRIEASNAGEGPASPEVTVDSRRALLDTPE